MNLPIPDYLMTVTHCVAIRRLLGVGLFQLLVQRAASKPGVGCAELCNTLPQAGS